MERMLLVYKSLWNGEGGGDGLRKFVNNTRILLRYFFLKAS